jgi:hypothetical protein
MLDTRRYSFGVPAMSLPGEKIDMMEDTPRSARRLRLPLFSAEG